MPRRTDDVAGAGPPEHRGRTPLSRVAAGLLGLGLLVSACSGSPGSTHRSTVTDGPASGVSIAASTTSGAAATIATAPSTPTSRSRSEAPMPTRTTPTRTVSGGMASGGTTPVASAAAPSKPSGTMSPAQPAPSSAEAVHLPLCRSSGLAITAQRGSGAMQAQYATIRFVNRSDPGCWLVGYATATLLANGHPLGHPVTAAHAGSPSLYLAAGRAASTALHGPSTCNAGVSDQVRISAPGQTAETDLALPMRACALIVDPFRRA